MGKLIDCKVIADVDPKKVERLGYKSAEDYLEFCRPSIFDEEHEDICFSSLRPMEKPYYIVFSFETGVVLVKYTCKGKFVSEAAIEDAAVSYYDSDAYSDEFSCIKIVEDILSSFEGLHYTFIDTDWVDMDWCRNEAGTVCADAHLIDAAPEMYRMLVHIEDVMDDSSGCGEISIEEIRRILKKARGEE